MFKTAEPGRGAPRAETSASEDRAGLVSRKEHSEAVSLEVREAQTPASGMKYHRGGGSQASDADAAGARSKQKAGGSHGKAQAPFLLSSQSPAALCWPSEGEPAGKGARGLEA